MLFNRYKLRLYFKFLVVVIVVNILIEIRNSLINRQKQQQQQQPVNDVLDLEDDTDYTKNFTDFFVKSNEFDDYVDLNCPLHDINSGQGCLKMLNEYNYTTGMNGAKILNFNYYHTFWEFSDHDEAYRDLGMRTMELSIMSYLATQDLDRSKMLVWLLKPLNVSNLDVVIQKYADKGIIQFRTLNLSKLCLKGIFGTVKYYNICSHAQSDPVAYSDFVRFLVLYNYGGLYNDGDIIFLRDMKPFWNKNFAYRWSSTVTCNTAVMGFEVNSDKNLFIETLLKTLLAFITDISSYLPSLFHPYNVCDTMTFLTNVDLFENPLFKIYPTTLFDPAWLCNDGIVERMNGTDICSFNDFYELQVKTFNINRLFLGAYTYHIHMGNCGDCILKKNTYFYHLVLYFKSIIKSGEIYLYSPHIKSYIPKF